MTKVFAVNGSPKMAKGNTEVLLRPFLQGMEDAGAEVRLVYASKLKVKPCLGEFHCWTERPGECFIKDAMQDVYPALKEADIWVFGTPVYIPLPGDMANFINRLVPFVEPVLVTRGGRTRARTLPGTKLKSVVLVSTSGWWEVGNFGTVVRTMEEFAKDVSVEFAGPVLRPHVDWMRSKGELTEGGRKVLDAARQAGRQMVERGRIDPRLLRAISAPLISRREHNRWEME